MFHDSHSSNCSSALIFLNVLNENVGPLFDNNSYCIALPTVDYNPHTCTPFSWCLIVQFNHVIILDSTEGIDDAPHRHTHTPPNRISLSRSDTHTHTQTYSHPLQLVLSTHPAAHTDIHHLATTYQKMCSPPDPSSLPLKVSKSGELLPWYKLAWSREGVWG